MKKLYTTLFAVLITATMFSQVPQKMSYQAIIRNGIGELVKNTAVGMKISILQGTETGTAVYVETQTKITNANGLVTLEIGGGSPVTGTFAGIDWSTGMFFLKTETDPTGGTNFSILGVSQILSVPYSLYAKSSGDGIKYHDATQSVLGNNSPLINTGTRNLFIGKSSGMNNISGIYNTFLGSEAGYVNRIGNNNIAIGVSALRENDEGSENIAIGSNALEKNKVSSPGSVGGPGFQNIAIGMNAMRNAVSNMNLAIGANALKEVTTGSANTGIGEHVMGNLKNGSGNTAVGSASMIYTVGEANNNVAIGVSTGEQMTGNGNVFVGYKSGISNKGSYNVFLGNLSGFSSTWQNVSNRLLITNADNDIPLIYGEFDNSLVKINGSVNIRDVLNLTPRASAPTSPTEGAIYYNSTTHKLMVFDGSNWMACW